MRGQTVDTEKILGPPEHQLSIDGNIVRAQRSAALTAGLIIAHRVFTRRARYTMQP